jgi:ATP adenylyltransferase
MLHAEDDAKHNILYRGKSVFVTLNLYPYSNGHLMVIPNRHVPSLEDLDEATLSEIQTVTQRCLALLRAAYNPEGFNIGINIGSAAGAGLADHVHQHIVPRWAGDTNFMTTLAETRVIPQALEETYAELHALWLEKTPTKRQSQDKT